MASSTIQIANRALQKIGEDRITSLDQNSEGARQVSRCFNSLLGVALEMHPWNFARWRASLTASSLVPNFGFKQMFPLPNDFVALIDCEIDGWVPREIEGGFILCDASAPLKIRYTRLITDPSKFSALFAEALACLIALEMTEPLSQSNAKRQMNQAQLDKVLSIARNRNAVQRASEDVSHDNWELSRI